MATAYDNWLAAPYTEQEALDRARDEVSEDQILAVYTGDELAVAHEWLANSADLIGRLLKNPSVRLAISRDDLAALDVLSRVADCAFTERESAITQCAKAAIAKAAQL